MNTVAIFLLMQYVISTKAGLVNHVEGAANVTVMQSAEAGSPISTGTGGRIEVLLNPGSFLRIGENSEVVLDSVDLTAIAVRVVSGSAIIEASGVGKKNPIKVTTQELATEIVDDGLYVFTDGVAIVRTGKLRTAKSAEGFKKGWQLAQDDRGFQAAKLKGNSPFANVESWSQGRSDVIARANANAYSSLLEERPNRPRNRSEIDNVWMFAPSLGFYTFMPRNPYRSPYGNHYYSASQPPEYDNRSTTGDSGGSNSGSGAALGGRGISNGSFGSAGGGGSDIGSGAPVPINTPPPPVGEGRPTEAEQ